MSYVPPPEILERYASVLVDFALGGGRGVRPGEVVRIAAAESAKPLYAELAKAVWRAGGHVIGAYRPDDDRQINVSRDFYELAGDEQLDHFNASYMRGLVDQMDHQVTVLAEADPHALDSVDPAKIMRQGAAMRPLLDWRGEKENAGRFSWTLGLYGTPAMAAEAGIGLEDYWEQIVHACFLDAEDPIARWREVGERVSASRRWLDSLEIERLHVEGEDVDLHISLGQRRRWLGGRGRNIPSFELFTSPDWRGTEGWIYCNQPLYRYGNLVKGIRLTFAGRARDRGQRRGERARADGDDRHRRRRPRRRVLADRPAAVADHSLHGAHAVRRERRRALRQHAHRARPLLPGRLRRRPQRGARRALGRARLQRLHRTHRHRLHDRPRRHRHAARGRASA